MMCAVCCVGRVMKEVHCERCIALLSSFIYLALSRSRSLTLSHSLSLSLSLLSSLPLPLSLSLSLFNHGPPSTSELPSLCARSFFILSPCFALLSFALLCFALLCFTLLCYALVLRTTVATEASSPSRRHSDESYKRNHRQNKSPLQHHKTERKLEGCPAVHH